MSDDSSNLPKYTREPRNAGEWSWQRIHRIPCQKDNPAWAGCGCGCGYVNGEYKRVWSTEWTFIVPTKERK